MIVFGIDLVLSLSHKPMQIKLISMKKEHKVGEPGKGLLGN
jgi:hypothetical protein